MLRLRSAGRKAGIRETGHGFQRKSGHTQIIHQLILTIRIIRLINRKAIRGSQLCKQIVNPRKLMAEGRNHLRIRELGKAEQSELFGTGKQCENRLLQPDIDIGFTVSLIDQPPPFFPGAVFSISRIML